MRLPVAAALVATVFVAVAFSRPQRVATPAADVRVHIVATDTDSGLFVTALAPPPQSFMQLLDGPAPKVGDTLTCEMADPVLRCGETVLQPRGFMIVNQPPDIRVERESPRGGSNAVKIR